MATNAPRRLGRRPRAQRLTGIYVILNEGPHLLELAGAVLNADVRLIQYRAKAGIVAEHVELLRKMTRAAGALLILNDDWRATDRFDCDGVHLGPGDDGFECVSFVRDKLGERIIGLSCGTLDEILVANDGSADYLGVGSVYVTESKSDAGLPIGLDGLRTLVRASRLPVAAIGGITPETIPALRESGAAMAAVISAISSAPDCAAAARELVGAWHRR
jgi:thiamine-phosphate pyrophosphorylase